MRVASGNPPPYVLRECQNRSLAPVQEKTNPRNPQHNVGQLRRKQGRGGKNRPSSSAFLINEAIDSPPISSSKEEKEISPMPLHERLNAFNREENVVRRQTASINFSHFSKGDIPSSTERRKGHIIRRIARKKGIVSQGGGINQLIPPRGESHFKPQSGQIERLKTQQSSWGGEEGLEEGRKPLNSSTDSFDQQNFAFVKCKEERKKKNPHMRRNVCPERGRDLRANAQGEKRETKVCMVEAGRG